MRHVADDGAFFYNRYDKRIPRISKFTLAHSSTNWCPNVLVDMMSPYKRLSVENVPWLMSALSHVLLRRIELIIRSSK